MHLITTVTVLHVISPEYVHSFSLKKVSHVAFLKSVENVVQLVCSDSVHDMNDFNPSFIAITNDHKGKLIPELL